MRILTNEDIESVLTMEGMVASLREAFIDLEAGAAVERPRSHTYTPLEAGEYYLFKSMDGGLSRYRMHAIRMTSDRIREVERDGTLRREKIPAAHGDQWVGMILLFSMDQLEPVALLQDGFLQRMRVGATSALAAECLVDDGVTEAGMIGTGWQAGAQLFGLAVTRPNLRRIKVYSKSPQHRERFCADMASQVPFDLTPVDSAREALAGQTFWILATNALEPVCDGSWLTPGSHVNSIQGRELDAAALQRADRVVVRAQIPPSHWGPPDFEPLESRRTHERTVDIRSKTVPLGAVLSGQVKRQADWITVFGGGGTGGSAGLGVQFAAVSRWIYDQAIRRDLGYEIDGHWFRQPYTP